jgi:hypothetical protein
LPRDSDLSCDSPESAITDIPGSGDIYLRGLRSFKIIFAPPSPATEHIAVEAYLIAQRSVENPWKTLQTGKKRGILRFPLPFTREGSQVQGGK